MRNCIPSARLLFAALVAVVALAACSTSGPRKLESHGPAKSAYLPVTPRYTVKAGDTLYSIAWRYGFDFRELARINSIGAPYTIRIGQVIKLASPPPAEAPKTGKGSDGSGFAFIGGAVRAGNEVKQQAATASSVSAPVRPLPAAGSGSSPLIQARPVVWLWPATGRVIGRFSDGVRVNKGIDIGGKLGDSVRSTREGIVVYAGNGLAGYGNLVIIKHDDIYLSAYAHNQAILVKEGQSVKAGDKIAEIGSSGAAYPKLHFEIRRDGKPVDPMQLLPRR